MDAERARGAVAHVRARSAAGAPVRADARIALHFHPDSDVAGGSPLLQMLADGRYLSQFATGTSNGGLTGASRGDRWRWEQRIFGGLYDDADPVDRPVYGALGTVHDGYGPAPRFGSAHLRLRASCLERTTFVHPDSAFEPTAFGVAERMGLQAMLIADGRADPLDRYVEAHVHGGVSLPHDVEALVLDPCYRGTDLERAAEAAGLDVQWHPGYVLRAEVLAAHPDYRGGDVATLGLGLMRAGRLTPRELGEARSAPGTDPQLLKRLWHCVAAFGRVADDDSA